MIYDNCIKYINNELKRILSIDEWKEKRVLLYGMDSLSKTVYMILKEYGVCELEYYDDSEYNKKWAGDNSVEDIDEAILEIIKNAGVIIVSTKIDRLKLMKTIQKRSLNTLKNIIDLSGIRMNKMPNPIVPTEYEKLVDLKECHEILMNILNTFCDFCDKHNLRYFLDYGTLLGAVRCKGFIPWDDDLDVCMPVPDYLKFKDLFPRNGDFFLDSLFNETVKELSPSNLLKIKSKKLVREYNHFPLRTMTGLGLDVFPLCGYPSDPKEQKSYLSEYMKWSNIWKEKVVIPYGTQKYSDEEHRNIFKKMQQIITRYNYDSSEFIAPAYFERDSFLEEGKNRIMPKKWYDLTIKMQFEDRKFNVPGGYDMILSKWYGDYMKIPPEEQRKQLLLKKRYKVSDFERYM